MNSLSKVTDGGKCSKCGSADMTLARDQVLYTPFAMEAGAWTGSGCYAEDLDNDDPLGNERFFCTACGEYHEVPDLT